MAAPASVPRTSTSEMNAALSLPNAAASSPSASAFGASDGALPAEAAAPSLSDAHSHASSSSLLSESTAAGSRWPTDSTAALPLHRARPPRRLMPSALAPRSLSPLPRKRLLQPSPAFSSCAASSSMKRRRHGYGSHTLVSSSSRVGHEYQAAVDEFDVEEARKIDRERLQAELSARARQPQTQQPLLVPAVEVQAAGEKAERGSEERSMDVDECRWLLSSLQAYSRRPQSDSRILRHLHQVAAASKDQHQLHDSCPLRSSPSFLLLSQHPTAVTASLPGLRFLLGMGPAEKKREEEDEGEGGAEAEEAPWLSDSNCTVCGDGGELLLCDRRGCRRVYHPACVGLKEAPAVWDCPVHACAVCRTRVVDPCQACRCCHRAFCDGHFTRQLRYHSSQLQCITTAAVSVPLLLTAALLLRPVMQSAPSRKGRSCCSSTSSQLRFLSPAAVRAHPQHGRVLTLLHRCRVADCAADAGDATAWRRRCQASQQQRSRHWSAAPPCHGRCAHALLCPLLLCIVAVQRADCLPLRFHARAGRQRRRRHARADDARRCSRRAGQSCGRRRLADHLRVSVCCCQPRCCPHLLLASAYSLPSISLSCASVVVCCRSEFRFDRFRDARSSVVLSTNCLSLHGH